MDNKKDPLPIVIVFVVLAGFFLLDPIGSPVLDRAGLNGSDFTSTKLVRDPAMEATTKRIDFAYNCNNCHQHFKGTANGKATGALTGQLMAEHVDLKLNHGDNNRCLNCHHPEDKEALVAHDGSKINFANSIDLCKKCHGPKYRDWRLGLHGRPNGYWDQSKGVSKKAVCVQCHDPHSPHFEPIAPAPAPVVPHGKTKDALEKSSDKTQPKGAH